MNYNNIYNQIIDRRKQERYTGYTETHHIIPKSLGGTDETGNLVKLSAREHFICHYLLIKIYKPGTVSGDKMLKAFIMMLCCKSETQERYVSSRRYEMLRQQFSKLQSEQQSGEKNSQHGTMWISNLELRQNKKIKKSDIIPEGWIKKRIVDFENYLNPPLKIKNRKTKQKQKQKTTTQPKTITNKNKNAIKAEISIEKKLNRIQQHIEWYELYKVVGFDEFVKITGYKYSKPNLVAAFAKLVPEFIPQNGKKRFISR